MNIISTDKKLVYRSEIDLWFDHVELKGTEWLARWGQKMKTKKYIHIAAFALVSVLQIGCSNPQSNSTVDNQSKSLIVYGGTIRTVDDTLPTAEAMLVTDGRIVAFGNAATLMQQSPGAEQVNLEGKTILPGFIDSHVHVRELGMDASKANLVGVRSTEDIVERLVAHYPNPAKDMWLIGQGWDEGWFGSAGYPDRQLLDEAFPNNPVHLESLHGFAGFYNGKALEIAKITNNTPDPEVGQILRRPDGTATGVMLTLAQGLINQHIPTADINMRKDAITKGLEIMVKAGVTSVHEAGMTNMDAATFMELAEESKLSIRVYGMLNGNDNELMNHWFERGIHEQPDTMFAVRSIKVFYDGSLGSRTALMQEPYSDDPAAANPTERITPEQLNWLAENAAEKGFQMAVHAIGDEGNNRTLSIYENALAPYPTQDHRWRIEHAQVVLPDYFERSAKLGVISSVQSSHAVGDSGWAEDRVGPNRIGLAYAWRKILDAGAPLILNSDLPGEPWKPMETLYFAVTRNTLDNPTGNGWYKDQALTTGEAIDAMSKAGAHSAFQDGSIGTLSVGKWADFVVLDTDPYIAEPATLKDIEVLSTWVAGRKVFTKE
ncbi:amidohydrolase [Kordiimonas aquimaris]|uniref:amidohydrolase n=1 Tax=Kordiimonas aquimaris TaxID=707591 RepID=UPI0021CE2FC2|nr:amidohydrolase [Kordiimonas aquimaris]